METNAAIQQAAHLLWRVHLLTRHKRAASAAAGIGAVLVVAVVAVAQLISKAHDDWHV